MVFKQTLIGHPSHGHQRGLHVLHTMKAISPILHENLVDLWDKVIPKLVKYIEGEPYQYVVNIVSSKIYKVIISPFKLLNFAVWQVCWYGRDLTKLLFL